MFKQKMLKFTPLLVACGLTLGGCATKQVWSPALEDAQNTYAQISQDPVVASLAAAELQAARRQLTVAEAAADQFRKLPAINHEAKLAKIKTLVAQQVARSQSANHSLQVALGQQTLLPEEQVLAATMVEVFEEPILAAAEPTTDNPQDIASQIAALSQQLAALQAQIGQTLPTEIPANQQMTVISDSLKTNKPAAEPVLSAALPAPSIEMQKPRPSAEQLSQKLRAINARPISQGMSLIIGERYFDQGTARLWKGRVARHLDNVTAVLINNPDLTLNIEAHTDNVQDQVANYDLSIDRAVAIKSALVLRGIDESRINAEGFGDTQPIADNLKPLGRLQNRRVELIFPFSP